MAFPLLHRGQPKWSLVTFLIIITVSCRNVTCTQASTIGPSEQPPACSLNGELDDNGVCTCEKPWSGPQCETMNFKPVTFPQGYGMAPNKTTWGGDMIVLSNKDNSNSDEPSYHLFVTAMTGGCSLRKWTTHSRIEHAVSDKVTGPFQFRDVAVPTFSHNPKIIQLQDGSLALIHIGDGSGPADANGNCTSPSIDLFESSEDAVESKRSRRQLALEKEMATSPGLQDSDANTVGSTIHISPSVDGPWSPLLNNTLGNCNNPAPFVHDTDGQFTIYLVCSSANHSELKQAHDISGPWTTVSQITPFETTGQSSHSNASSNAIHFEDPSLYIDRRGFHIIYHMYDTEENPPHGHDCTKSTVAAHVFSVDGKKWYKSPGQPFGTQIEVEGGETITISTRERPSLVIQKDSLGHAQITHLINGVCSAINCPDGPPPGCVDCKYDHWDYTLIQPLDI